jgi:hypothetical protein
MPDPTTKTTKVHPEKAELILATTGAKKTKLLQQLSERIFAIAASKVHGDLYRYGED